MKFIFIHCTGGAPDECWYPWLKGELEKLGHRVIIPRFPTPEGQSLENWMKVFEPYLKKIDENTVFIGRSIGPPFILRILEKIDIQIRAAFLVAGFCSYLKMPEFAPLVDSFIKKPFDWKKINLNCKEFYVYHGADDPVVSLHYGKELNKKVNGKLTVIDDGGHFNIGTPYSYKFEKILEDIKKLE
ncbi:RBBP9/YdeN family alpha/beta hydrolase [Bacteroidota bacterium]